MIAIRAQEGDEGARPADPWPTTKERAALAARGCGKQDTRCRKRELPGAVATSKTRSSRFHVRSQRIIIMEW